MLIKKFISKMVVCMCLISIFFIGAAPGTAFADGIPVFPGAEGFGSTTVAGRGGTIYRVDTLSDNEPAVPKGDGTYHGSLRAACEASGPRIIVFEISGTINLSDHIYITNPYCTIAGQTAPSPGITLKNAGISVETYDVLIQHLRIRPGDGEIGPAYNLRDCIQILRPSYNVVVDHISGSWAVDENGSTWDVHDVTVSNSIFSEALHSPLHPKGPHSMGFLVGDCSENISFMKNLVATSRDRFPRIKDDTSTVVSNNLLYNCGAGTFSAIGGIDQPYPPIVSYVGNVFIPGPEALDNPVTGDQVAIETLSGGVNEDMQVYLSDNVMYDGTLFYYNTVDDPRVSTAPVWWSGLTVMSSDDVEDYVLANAGARPADRDSVDIRAVNDVINGTGSIIVSQDDVGGWPTLAVNSVSFVVPTNPHGDDDSDGYTNIEEKLHQMAAEVEGRTLSEEIIIDNSDSNCTYGGTWTVSMNALDFYGPNYRHDGTSGADTTSKWAKWTPNITSAGSYDIYMRWPANYNRPDQAPLEIGYNGSTDTSKWVNQQTNSGTWVLIGTYNLSAGTSNYVKILATDAGYTIADAVKFVKNAPIEIIIDNSDSNCTYGGTWTVSTSALDFYGPNYRHDGTSGADTTSKWAKWTPNITSAGNYEIYMRWPANINRPDQAPLEIVYNGGTDTSKWVNQQTNGGTWMLIGTYNLSAGTGNNVKILATDAGYTIADAVKFVKN